MPLIRLTIIDSDTVGFHRVPVAGVHLDGAIATFCLRDHRGIGQDVIGNCVGLIDNDEAVIELSLPNEDVPSFLQHVVQHNGDIIPAWDSVRYQEAEDAWNKAMHPSGSSSRKR